MPDDVVDPTAGTSSEDGSTRLRDVLGAEPSAAVLALPASTRELLVDLVEDACRRQSASLEEAFAATVKHVPFPVRGIAKRMLMG